ncbi:MAG: hypothetical protein H0U72_13645 [Nitrosospira sp.]|nr:hypothetical protein [Nitrosospira sp.]
MARKKKADSGPADSFYQDDFGGFNPRFGGVTIRIASQAAYDEFVSFLTSETLPGNKEEPLGPILMRSVMEHELRHYHDFLLGSYNAMLFRSRLQAVLNGIKALRAVKELPGDVFPLPLSRWMTLTAEERDALLEEWAAFSIGGKAPVVVPVPIVPEEELLRPRDPESHAIEDDDPAAAFSLAAEYAVRGYAGIPVAAEGTKGSNVPAYLHLLTPANIQEVLALNVQLRAIFRAQGEKQARAFARFFLNGSTLPPARLWRLLLDASLRWQSGEAEGEDDDELERLLAASFQVMTIGTWTLLGSHITEDGSASPAARLTNLLKHLLMDRAEVNTAQDSAPGVSATWDYWDTALGLNSWRTSLNESLEWASRGVDFYRHAHEMSEPGWERDFHAILHDMMEAYSDDQRILIEHLLEQPEDIVGANRYLSLPPGTLPMPLFRLQMDNNSALDASTLDQKIFDPVMTVDFDGGVGVLSCLLKTSLPTYRERAADAIAFEHIAQLCDLAFSPQAPYGRSGFLEKTLLSELEKTVCKTLRSIV